MMTLRIYKRQMIGWASSMINVSHLLLPWTQILLKKCKIQANVLLFLNIYVTQNSNTCLQGSSGLPGRNGVNGHNGLPGRDGRDGAKGEKGEMGASGTDTDHRNWKQCAWKSGDSRDIGLIKVGWCICDQSYSSVSITNTRHIKISSQPLSFTYLFSYCWTLPMQWYIRIG